MYVVVAKFQIWLLDRFSWTGGLPDLLQYYHGSQHDNHDNLLMIMIIFFQWVAPAEGVSSITLVNTSAPGIHHDFFCTRHLSLVTCHLSSITLVNTPAPGIHHHLFCTHKLFKISSLCIIPSSIPSTLKWLLTTWLLQVPHHVNKIIMSLIIIIITWLIHPGASREHHLPPAGWRELQTGLRALPGVSWHHRVTIFIMIIIIIIGWPSLSWSSTCDKVHRHLYHPLPRHFLIFNDNDRSVPAAWLIFTLIVLLIYLLTRWPQE